MSGYFIIQINVTNSENYKEYIEKEKVTLGEAPPCDAFYVLNRIANSLLAPLKDRPTMEEVCKNKALQEPAVEPPHNPDMPSCRSMAL